MSSLMKYDSVAEFLSEAIDGAGYIIEDILSRPGCLSTHEANALYKEYRDKLVGGLKTEASNLSGISASEITTWDSLLCLELADSSFKRPSADMELIVSLAENDYSAIEYHMAIADYILGYNLDDMNSYIGNRGFFADTLEPLSQEDMEDYAVSASYGHIYTGYSANLLWLQDNTVDFLLEIIDNAGLGTELIVPFNGDEIVLNPREQAIFPDINALEYLVSSAPTVILYDDGNNILLKNNSRVFNPKVDLRREIESNRSIADAVGGVNFIQELRIRTRRDW